MDENKETSVLDEVAKMQEAEKVANDTTIQNPDAEGATCYPLDEDIFDCNFTDAEEVDIFTAVALAVNPFDNIMVIKRNGKLVVRTLDDGESPFMKFIKKIFRFFVSKKKAIAETVENKEAE